VLWEGYTDDDATWEPWEYIQGTTEKVLAEFYHKYPDVPTAPTAPTTTNTYQSKQLQSKHVQGKWVVKSK